MRSMSRALVLPAAVVLTLALGACSDGPSVSSQTRDPEASSSASADPATLPEETPTSDADDAESTPAPETPSEGAESPSDDEETATPDPQETPDAETPDPETPAPETPGDEADGPTTPPGTDPPTPPAPESPTAPAEDPSTPSEEPTTETPSDGDPEEPTDPAEEPGAPGGDGVRAAVGAARATYPAAEVISVVHIDDNSTPGPPTDTGFLVVLVAGDERVELTLDAAYGPVTETSTTADAATLALVEEDHLTLEDAFGRVVDDGMVDGEIVRSVELVSWEGQISWDFYVFGTSTMVASVDATSGETSPTAAGAAGPPQ